MTRRAADRDQSPFLAGLKLAVMVILVGTAAAGGVIGVIYVVVRALTGRHVR